MHKFLICDHDGCGVLVPVATDHHYNQARRGHATLLQIHWETGVVSIYNPKGAGGDGCWQSVENNPTENGLYLVQNDGNAPFDYKVAAVWENDHWRTPSVGRIDGDNRIPHVTKWKGPIAK